MGSHEPSDVLIREPMLEGIWYPETKEELIDAIHAQVEHHAAPSGLRGLLVPFGPLDEVGPLAGPAFSAIAGQKFDRAVVMGPCTIQHSPRVFVPESTHFRTPLGMSPVDLDALDLILDSSMLVEKSDLPHLEENSLELSMVFLHYHLGDIPVLPLLAGESSTAVYRTLAAVHRVLETEAGGRTLYVMNANLPADHNLTASSGSGQDCLLETARTRPGLGESLIICAMGATLVGLYGLAARWSGPGERLQALATGHESGDAHHGETGIHH